MDEEILDDLDCSGLEPEDLNCREVGHSELASCRLPASVQGYVIPYYNIDGDPLPHYRLKLLNHTPKYKQPPDSSNYVYFPPGFNALLQEVRNKAIEKRFIFLTEGEKKAAKAVKEGYLCAAFGGVDSWRTRKIVLPPGVTVSPVYGKQDVYKLELPPNSYNAVNEIPGPYAVGLLSLFEIIAKLKLTVFIVYDTDDEDGLKPAVQIAAAKLGHELRHRGIPIHKIKQLVLPFDWDVGDKCTLDEFLAVKGPDEFDVLIKKTLKKRVAFPQHPNPTDFINKGLQGRLDRRTAQELALTVITELDSRGRRLVDQSTQVPYYFDERKLTLMPAQLLHRNGDPMHETSFGQYMYKRFGMSEADQRVLKWIATMLTGEDPVDAVDPQRVLCLHPSDEDRIAFQISDSQYVCVSADTSQPLTLHNNGDQGLLFVKDQVEYVDPEEVMDAFYQMVDDGDVQNWWLDVLKNVQLKGGDNVKKFLSILYYLSPWLNRWRGFQPPIEMYVGEAGSGKSSLLALRQAILTGKPDMRNMPSDVKDWYASIVSTGGIHVTDNVTFTNKELRQRLSDEMCRITTASEPFVELRKLYTTAGQFRVPVNTTFAVTAIQQPFYNIDILQRAAVVNFESIRGAKDGDWVTHRLYKVGGRARWLAHQLYVLHRFLNAVVHEGDWDPEFWASHRLNHYEQALSVMGTILGIDTEWIPMLLAETTDQTLSENDWILEGLKTYAETTKRRKAWKSVKFTAGDVAEWVDTQDDYRENPFLRSSRKLGKYMQTNKGNIERICGIKHIGTMNNRQVYSIVP